MASIREEVALERSFQCMRLIHRDGDITTRDLAERMQISNGAAYYVLTGLIEKGYVKAENFKNNPKICTDYSNSTRKTRDYRALRLIYETYKQKGK